MIDPDGSRRQRQPLTATQRALGLLTRREHSRQELTRKLAARGLDTGEVEAAVERLASEGWQDDARFAEALVRSRASSGYGPIRIRAELATHGLDRDAVAAALDSYEGDWTGNVRDLIRRRFGGAVHDHRAAERKATDFLIRRGFTSDHIRFALHHESDE